MRCLLMCTIASVSLLCLPRASSGQVLPEGRSATLASAHTVAAQSQTSSVGLSAKISIELNDVPVSNALQAIARQADLRIAMAEPVLAVRKRITLTLTDVEAGAAIRAVLAGTNVSMIVAPSGQVMFVRQTSTPIVERGVIAGKVINAKTKQPVAGVTVTVDTSVTGVVTGSEGTFRFPVAAGDHVLHVRGVGFTRQTRRLVVASGETVTIEFVLEPSASVLDEVIVTGTVVATERKAIPTPITVITAKDIEQRGVTRVEQLLRGEVPGMLALETGTLSYQDRLGRMAEARVYSRGSSDIGGAARPPKIFLDGIELFDPLYLGTIDPQSIERIEILTGPQAATIYGSGSMGGVMQIFTKRGTNRATPDIMLSLRYGLLENNVSTGRTPLHNHSVQLDGGSGTSFSYSGNLSYNYSGRWQPHLYSRRHSTSVGIRHQQGKLNASGSVSTTAESNGTSDGSTGPYIIHKILSGDWTPRAGWSSILPMGKVNRSSGHTVGLTLDYSVTATWQHQLTVGRNQTNLELEPERPRFSTASDTMYSHQRSSGQRTSASYNFTWIPTALRIVVPTITLGTTGSWGEKMQISGLAPTRETTVLTAPSVSQELRDVSWGSFTNIRIAVFDQLFITLGLRGERNLAYGESHKVDWTPKNGIAYTHEYNNLTIKLLGSYGSGTRPPRAGDRLGAYELLTGFNIDRREFFRASPLLRPERERGPQGGVEIYFGNHGSLTVTHYQQNVDDLFRSLVVDTTVAIRLSSNDTVKFVTFQFLNVGKMRKKGWEGTGSLNIGQISLKGTYFWNDSRIITIDPGIPFTGEGFRNLPTHAGNVTATYARAGTSFTLVNNITGGIITDQGLSDLGATEPRWSRLRQYIWRARENLSVGRSRPGYVKSDLVLTQRMSDRVSALVNIMNLGNSYGRDVSDVGFPALGRQTVIGVSIRHR